MSAVPKEHFIALLLLAFASSASIRAQARNVFGIEMFKEIMKESRKPLNGDIVIEYPNYKQKARVQKTLPSSMAFMCANRTGHGVGRSWEIPTSVHQLRPGDIDVIGAMGDSLIAGNGALEEFAFGTMIENRGVSWCIGGQGTWRQFLTLPNILKEFNDNLVGYSTGTGEFLSHNAQLNVAFPVSADADALRQAKILVKKMKADARIDVRNSWKMVTLFFGANDLCSAQCFDKTAASSYQHAIKLMQALDYLQEKLPRTFVNLVPVLDPSVSVRIDRSWMCYVMHRLFCTCFHQGGADEMATIVNLTREYQEAEEMLINSGRYNVRDDFTVVLQPFIKFFNAPDDESERSKHVIDISYITHDCFHFSQKGHALGANMLWNNLLEPIGDKNVRKMNSILETFKCPSDENPYLFTWKNSRNFHIYGKQIFERS